MPRVCANRRQFFLLSKVWWHAATLLYLFYINRAYISIFTYIYVLLVEYHFLLGSILGCGVAKTVARRLAVSQTGDSNIGTPRRHSTERKPRSSTKKSSSKKMTVKGLCDRCLSEVIDWRYSQPCWCFDTAL
jgi:hypothetical protein